MRGLVAAETRLDRMEKILYKLIERQNEKGKTWAHITQQPAPAAGKTIPLPTTQRPAIRIRMEGAGEKTHGEILAEARQSIPGAYAIRPLRSGDIDVMVPDQATKDKILNQPEIEGIKVLRQDYLAELPGVPLSVSIASGKDADNTRLIQEICTATKRTIPTIAINQVRWLYNPKRDQRDRRGPVKTRGTVILSLPTLALQ